LYSVFGGGLYCDGNNGVEILLDGSDVVVVYELYNESGSTGIVISGYGDTINFWSSNKRRFTTGRSD